MNYSNSVLIKINDFTDIRKFANAVTKFESDINIYYNDSKYYDAKSIMAVFALDMSQPKYIEIISNNKDEILKFKESMAEFECKDLD